MNTQTDKQAKEQLWKEATLLKDKIYSLATVASQNNDYERLFRLFATWVRVAARWDRRFTAYLRARPDPG